MRGNGCRSVSRIDARYTIYVPLKEDKLVNSQDMAHPQYRRDLGDGLVARWSTAADLDGVQQLYGFVFRGKPDEPANPRMPFWAADGASGRHPLVDDGTGAFALVEDTRSRMIVAALMVMRATWEYAGISFGVGRPEAVASHPDYRNRGLIRAIFDMFHARSAARGQLAQGITGIAYFYRQLGYEYALDLGGIRSLAISTIPQLKEDTPEPYRLRPAVVDDIGQLTMLYERERTRHQHGAPLLVSAKVDTQYWQWLLAGQNVESGEGWGTLIVEDAQGRSIGYVLHRRIRSREAASIYGIAVEPHVSLAAVMPSILRGFAALAPTLPVWREELPAPVKIHPCLGAADPAYDVVSERILAPLEPPYAWYIRVPDLAGFLQRIAPALERRLAGSTYAGHTGELKITFYRGGLRLVFANGRLSEATDWRAPVWGDEAQAGFPPLVFLQLLFGRRSFAELAYAFPDVWANDAERVLLETLFPKQISWAIPQD